jgi:hypothetical protein
MTLSRIAKRALLFVVGGLILYGVYRVLYWNVILPAKTASDHKKRVLEARERAPRCAKNLSDEQLTPFAYSRGLFCSYRKATISGPINIVGPPHEYPLNFKIISVKPSVLEYRGKTLPSIISSDATHISTASNIPQSSNGHMKKRYLISGYPIDPNIAKVVERLQAKAKHFCKASATFSESAAKKVVNWGFSQELRLGQYDYSLISLSGNYKSTEGDKVNLLSIPIMLGADKDIPATAYADVVCESRVYERSNWHNYSDSPPNFKAIQSRQEVIQSRFEDTAGSANLNRFPGTTFYSEKKQLSGLQDASFYPKGWWQNPFSPNLI